MYIAHSRFVAVLCMLYKIRCNPMHPLNDSLPGPYVPVRVTRGALVARSVSNQIKLACNDFCDDVSYTNLR